MPKHWWIFWLAVTGVRRSCSWMLLVYRRVAKCSSSLSPTKQAACSLPTPLQWHLVSVHPRAAVGCWSLFHLLHKRPGPHPWVRSYSSKEGSGAAHLCSELRSYCITLKPGRKFNMTYCTNSKHSLKSTMTSFVFLNYVLTLSDSVWAMPYW